MSDFTGYLSQGLKLLEIDYTQEQLAQCARYYHLLIDWNRKMNLTAITEEKEVAVKHFLDSLMVLKFISLKPKERLIDIGTGAGFPGLPLKIFRPDLDVVLLDSLAKRCHFLTAVQSELGLDRVEIIHGRAEEFGRKMGYREEFSLVFARAVTSLPVLLEYCLPFLKIGGVFFALKGPDINSEIENSSSGLDILGGKLIEKHFYQLPLLGDDRSLVMIQKIKNTPEKYPRKAGIPEKRPL